MKKLLAVLILGTSSQAMAVGEILALQSRGTEYCPGSLPVAVTPSNDLPLFVKFNGDGTLNGYVQSVKASPDFVFNVSVNQIGTLTYSFHADYLVDNDNYASLIGKIKLDTFGFIKSLTGTATRVGLINNCYSSGKITGKRIK
ncbi:MAG: hypothetical protein ACR65R_11430 [Methylomicrobium sp.]